jgi:hypothetical protein
VLLKCPFLLGCCALTRSRTVSYASGFARSVGQLVRVMRSQLTIKPVQEEKPRLVRLVHSLHRVKERRQEGFHRGGKRRLPIAPVPLESPDLIGCRIPDQRAATRIQREHHMASWKQHIATSIPIIVLQRFDPVLIPLGQLGAWEPFEPGETPSVTETIEILERLARWEMIGPAINRWRMKSCSPDRNPILFALLSRCPDAALLSYPLHNDLSPISHKARLRELLCVRSVLALAAGTHDGVNCHYARYLWHSPSTLAKTVCEGAAWPGQYEPLPTDDGQEQVIERQ